MLISLSAISQSVYPKKAVLDKDTVGIVSIDQVRKVNKSFVDLDECQEMKDSLTAQIRVYDKLHSEMNNTITSQDKEILIKQSIITQQQTILQDDDKIAKKMNRRIVLLKVERIALAVALVTLAAIHFL